MNPGPLLFPKQKQKPKKTKQPFKTKQPKQPFKNKKNKQSEELKGDEQWRALDVIVDHSGGQGWSQQLRPMTAAEVQSTRVLKLKLEAGEIGCFFFCFLINHRFCFGGAYIFFKRVFFFEVFFLDGFIVFF